MRKLLLIAAGVGVMATSLLLIAGSGRSYALNGAYGQPHPGTAPLNEGEQSAVSTCASQHGGPWGAIWVNSTTGDSANATSSTSGYYYPNVLISGAPLVDPTGTTTSSSSPNVTVYIRGSVYNCSSNSAVDSLNMTQTYAISTEMVTSAAIGTVASGRPPTTGSSGEVYCEQGQTSNCVTNGRISGLPPSPSTTTSNFPENGSGIENIGYIPGAKQPPIGPYFSRGLIPDKFNPHGWSDVGLSVQATLNTANLPLNYSSGVPISTATVNIYRCFGYDGLNSSGTKNGQWGVYNCGVQTITVRIHWTTMPNGLPTGSVTRTCVRDPVTNVVTYTVTAKYADAQGTSSSPAAAALATYDSATNTYPHIASQFASSPYTSGTFSWSGTTWPASGTIYLLVYDVGVNGAYSGPYQRGTATRPPCPPPLATPTCSDFAVTASTQNSGSPQPNEAYSVQVSIDAGSTTEATTLANENYTLTIGGVSHVATSKTASGNTVTVVFGGLIAAAATGTYPFTFSDLGPTQIYTVPTSGTDPNCAVQVGNKPYVQVFSGDVQAGVSVPTTPDNGQCTDPNTSGDISSWNNDQAGGYSGAGGRFGAEALGIIEGFVSAQGTSPTGAGLSFANTVGVGGDTYGGHFNGSDPCMTMPTPTTTSASSVTLGPATYSIGSHLVQYVNGDVYIKGDQIYASGWDGNIKNIPSVMVVAVGGNIYIDPSVHELDGMYVAEVDGSGNGGTIYTCAPGGTAPNPDSTTLFGNCSSSQLVVNGSLVGNQVDLLRACGTVNLATVGDADVFTGGGLASCGIVNHAAEVFNYGATDWIGQSTLGSNTASATWDSVVSLPPVL